jgi:MFS family permease
MAEHSAASMSCQMFKMARNGEPLGRRKTRLRRGLQAARERSSHLRERLRPQNLRAPSLDWLNFLLADVRGGLGPYVGVFLTAEHGWSPTMAGLVSTVGGWLGLVAQTPIGAWLDRANRKRVAMQCGLLVLSVGAVVIAIFPSFWPVLLAHGAMQVVSGVFEPAVAALTVGLCTREVLTARMGRNAAWSRAGNIAAAILSGLIAWQFSARGVFLQVPVLAGFAAATAMTIPYSKVDLRRARGLEPDGATEAPQAWMTVLRNRRLLVFAVCSFLYELADAPLLTLVGQKLGSDRPGAGIMLTSALIIASQAGMLAASILVGKRADRLGYRWLMVFGFAMLPAQGVLTVLSGSLTYLIAVQVFGGVGTGLFAALTPIWLADATRGTGRYNLSQGAMATMRGMGATTSGLMSELTVEHLGYVPAFLGCGVICAAAAMLLWLGLPERQPSAQTAAPAK